MLARDPRQPDRVGLRQSRQQHQPGRGDFGRIGQSFPQPRPGGGAELRRRIRREYSDIGSPRIVQQRQALRHRAPGTGQYYRPVGKPERNWQHGR